jgi:hypothetical protein
LARLMAALDAVNARFGRGTLRPLSTGLARPWGTRHARLSPRYTTRLDELMEAKVCSSLPGAPLPTKPRRGGFRHASPLTRAVRNGTTTCGLRRDSISCQRSVITARVSADTGAHSASCGSHFARPALPD